VVDGMPAAVVAVVAATTPVPVRSTIRYELVPAVPAFQRTWRTVADGHRIEG
jgi:hypothetical protein